MSMTTTIAAAPLLVGEDDVARHLDVAAAHIATAKALALLAAGDAASPPRDRVALPGAEANTLWASAPALGALAVKLYPIVRDDVTRGSAFTVILYAAPAGTVRAIVSAELLGQRRTGAVSGIAAAALARADARTLGIVGAGGQAPHQLDALVHAHAFGEVLVAGRDAGRAERLADRARLRHGLPARVTTAQDATRRADVLVTITGSATPVVEGAWLRPGTLVIAAGSNVAAKRELDRVAVQRAGRLIVDDVATAARECGDVLANGLDLDLDRAQPLADAIAEGRRVGRDEVVLVETHGLAIEDLTCALHVVEAIERTAA